MKPEVLYTNAVWDMRTFKVLFVLVAICCVRVNLIDVQLLHTVPSLEKATAVFNERGDVLYGGTILSTCYI